MERRKDELEKKRQKLAELRRAREERKSALSEVQKPQTTPLASANPPPAKDRKAIDDLVALVLGERPSTPTAGGHSSDRGSDPGSEPPPYGNGSTPSTPSFPVMTHQQRHLPDFSTSNSILADIAPEEHVVYEKGIQTTESGIDAPQFSEEELRAQILEELEKDQKAKQQAEDEERKRAEIEKIEEKRELTDEEKRSILLSQEFVEFIDHSSKLVERALNEKYDFMKDYTIGADVEGDVGSGKRVKFLCEFWDERWSKNRSVTDVGWSPKHPELLVSSYNKNPMAVNEPDGVACIWNLHLLERPEFVFHSQSDVLTVMFSDFHPTYVIGGTYSGQIVLWDTRAKSLPVLKTPLSAGGHTHPVYSLSMVGTQNAHNLISASTDGTVCSWQLDMLAQPQESLELTHSQNHHNIEEVSITTLDFPDNETTTFWVGTEEGNIYQANRYDRDGSKAGINQYDAYKGHYGTITGMQFHPLFGPVDFSDLFLTCSVDWTVKLWRSRSITKTTMQPTVISPLYSFEQADDYVYDVKWSPTHPALFASVDGGAKFDLWNLNADTEVPIVSTIVGQQGKALNKITWDKEGKKTAIGSSDGKVYVYDIGEMAVPKSDEWNLLQKNISEMISTQENVGK